MLVVLVAGLGRVMVLVLIGVAVITVMMCVFAGVAIVAVMMLVFGSVPVITVVVGVLIGVTVLAMMMFVFVGMVVCRFFGVTVGQRGGCASQSKKSRAQNDGAASDGNGAHGHYPQVWKADPAFILN
jgi:hypothetical protein